MPQESLKTCYVVSGKSCRIQKNLTGHPCGPSKPRSLRRMARNLVGLKKYHLAPLGDLLKTIMRTIAHCLPYIAWDEEIIRNMRGFLVVSISNHHRATSSSYDPMPVSYGYIGIYTSQT